MLFVYPETMQMDAVEDSSEEHTLADHLDAMFAEDAPPLQWDSERAYTRSTIETYYLSHAAKPLGLEQLTEVCSMCLSPIHMCCCRRIVARNQGFGNFMVPTVDCWLYC